MPKKVTLPVREAPVELTQPKIINKWGASEAKWELDHEDELITVTTRSLKTYVGRLIGVDHYTITIDLDSEHGEPIVIFKHAIDSLS